MPLRDYSSLITSEHNQQPRFMAVVELLTGAAGEIYDALLATRDAFNLDQAVGTQLDTIGLWVGLSRQQAVPITGAYFTLDDPDLGLDVGYWLGPFESTEGIVLLDDTTYRELLKSRISLNYWQGSNQKAVELSESLFSEMGVYSLVIDNFDMSVTVFIGVNPPEVIRELFRRGFFPKAAGVRLSSFIEMTYLLTEDSAFVLMTEDDLPFLI